MRTQGPIAAMLALAMAACTTTPIVNDLSREQLGVSVLSVNLRDSFNHPFTRDGIFWRTRYQRIGQWLQNTHTSPDIIALQEAPGFWRCTFDQARQLGDYEAIDFLLDEVRAATGIQYRIAYLITSKEGGTLGGGFVGNLPSGGCITRGGRSLLYRPDRMKNSFDMMPATVAHDDQAMLPTSAYNSYPCCAPAAGREDVCPLIDGPPQTGQICAAPSGTAFTKRHLGDTGRTQSAVFTRFELVRQPGNYLHFYNVHMSWLNGAPESGTANINEIVADMEARFGGPRSNLLYPPVLVGDFNLDTNAVQFGDRFNKFHKPFWSPGLTGVLVGLPASFPPAKQQAYFNDQRVMPNATCEIEGGDTATLWSDHCALYFRIEPLPPGP
jgi:endonuclease/exonuclease/phosphatase family metal-dependent hydrolase